MINASGYKVWPAWIEATLYQHSAIKEVCVVGIWTRFCEREDVAADM